MSTDFTANFNLGARPNEIVVVGGAKAPSDTDYVHVAQNNKSAWIKLDHFSPDPTKALAELVHSGIRSFTAEAKAKLRQDIAELTEFPPRNIAEGPGWGAEGIFGYPDGRCYTPNGEPVPVAYRAGVVAVAASGSLASWKDLVVRPLAGQHLPLFTIMACFAAPVVSLTSIQGNVGLMISGPPRKGKSTCLDLAASTCGQPLDDADGRYSKKATTTTHRLHQLMHYYGDLPFLIDELGSVDARSAQRGGFKDMAHLFNGVDARERFGDPLQITPQVRCIFIITSNSTQREMLAHETDDSAEAVADRLHELPVPRGEEGVFNAGHGSFANHQELAENVRRQVGQNYGTAMPAFLQRLVEERHKDPARLQRWLERAIRRFSRVARRRIPHGISSRALEAFGLVYAAGRLARRYGILPREVDCMAAALHCLRLNIGEKVEADPLQRLLSWAAATDAMDLRRRKQPPDLSDDAMAERGLFVGSCAGQSQIWISRSLFERTFHDHAVMLKTLSRRGILKKDHQRRTIQCRVRADKRMDRMYVFRGPDISGWLEENGFGERTAGRRR